MGNLIKLGLSIAIIGFILYKFDVRAVWDTILNANGAFLLAALAVQMLSQTVAAYRWSLIMGILKFKHSFGFYFRSYFKGSLFNQVLRPASAAMPIGLPKSPRMVVWSRKRFMACSSTALSAWSVCCC